MNIFINVIINLRYNKNLEDLSALSNDSLKNCTQITEIYLWI